MICHLSDLSNEEKLFLLNERFSSIRKITEWTNPIWMNPPEIAYVDPEIVGLMSKTPWIAMAVDTPSFTHHNVSGGKTLSTWHAVNRYIFESFGKFEDLLIQNINGGYVFIVYDCFSFDSNGFQVRGCFVRDDQALKKLVPDLRDLKIDRILV